jgi:hypothetical protein
MMVAKNRLAPSAVPIHHSADLDRIFRASAQKVFEAAILAGGYVKGKLNRVSAALASPQQSVFPAGLPQVAAVANLQRSA